MVQISIILILILMYFLIKSLNKNDQKRQNSMITLFSIEPDDINVVPTEKIFRIDPQGQYLFHGEIDSNAVTKNNTGDISICDCFVDVSVSFEKDILDVESFELEEYQNNESYAQDEALLKNLYEFYPIDLLTNYNGSGEPSLLYVGDDWVITLTIDPVFNTVYFKYSQIINDRVTTIKIWAKNKFCTIGSMHNRFNELVSKYENLPYNQFTGATRV